MPKAARKRCRNVVSVDGAEFDRLSHYSWDCGVVLITLQSSASRWPFTTLNYHALKPMLHNEGCRELTEHDGGSQTVFGIYTGVLGSQKPASKKDSTRLVLPFPGVDPLHCEVGHNGEGQYWVKDLGSSEGTYILVQGRSLRSEYALRVGDVFVVDGTSFKVEEATCALEKEQWGGGDWAGGRVWSGCAW